MQLKYSKNVSVTILFSRNENSDSTFTYWKYLIRNLFYLLKSLYFVLAFRSTFRSLLDVFVVVEGLGSVLGELSRWKKTDDGIHSHVGTWKEASRVRWQLQLLWGLQHRKPWKFNNATRFAQVRPLIHATHTFLTIDLNFRYSYVFCSNSRVKHTIFYKLNNYIKLEKL